MKVNDYYSERLQVFAEEFLRFDFLNGEIYLKKTRYGKKSGEKLGFLFAGTKDRNIYQKVQVRQKHYMVHRLIYCFYHKTSATGFQIDHINQNTLDNRIENLRAVTATGNQRNANQRTDNTSGVTGVHWLKARQKWVSRIEANGKRVHLGCFENIKDAIEARKAAEIKYNYHPNHGRPRQKV